MGRKEGPSAANTVKKNLSMLFNFAIKRSMGITFNPARYAERLKVNPDGYHTWTDQEIARFKKHHPKGSKARLALMLFLWTGAARQDVAAMGWQNIKGNRIEYRRGKTKIEASLPIHPELASELALVSRDQLLFLTHGKGLAYKPETLGNWFKCQCLAAGNPVCSAHGLRKALATLMANEGKSPDEIRSVMAHKTNQEGSTYTRRADRARLADSGFDGLSSTQGEQKLSNLFPKLDNSIHKSMKGKE
ncbi:MAG: tyrosine-type recombinase/integrase [Rhodobacterales bacterium]